MSAWAHSANEAGQRQSLRDHLLNTASLARDFAAAFDAAEAGWTTGLLHDAGKASPEWQERLACLEVGLPTRRADHKSLGAEICHEGGFRHGCLAIAGHHGGIPDHDQRPTDAPAPETLELFHEAVPEAAGLRPIAELVPPAWLKDIAVAEFGTRMLHSCLVDADYLDTSAHFAGSTVSPSATADMSALSAQLQHARRAFLSGRPASPVDLHRDAVFEACLQHAADSPGVFRLSAPTGSGKTIAAAAFALRHAELHGKRRVIVAVPFTTITEQNAAVYRSLLGDDVVLEHHSAVEPERLAGRGVENWDAPFVVTTTVQLFDSLFSNKPSKTRKLHRLAHSVIVLDEVQAIPEHLLLPILDGLKVLVEHFAVTVVMASATQPTWEVLKPWRDAHLTPREIVPDPPSLFSALRRVRYQWLPSLGVDDLVERANSVSASLVVVNTTGNARTIANRMMEQDDASTLHLSTRMCRAHRGQVLAEVRTRLADGEAVHLVSTQLIEAGVDLDFPTVMRQEAPAASLIQAAGRANREGRSDLGQVIIFGSDELATIRDYRTALGITRLCFADNPSLLDDPDAVSGYYAMLYAAAATDSSAMEIQRSRRQLAFQHIANQFHMINDASVDVIVDWEGSVHERTMNFLSNRMRRGLEVLPMGMLRSLQPFTVSLPEHFAKRPEIAALIEAPIPGIHFWQGNYDPMTGIGDDAPLSYVY